MVLFDSLLCDTCDAIKDLWVWGLISSTIDVLVVIATIILIFGYAFELPIWIALNIGVNQTLKYIINEPRPFDCGCDPGMPSGHAQLATFLLIIFITWKYKAWYKSDWPKVYLIYQIIMATALAFLVVISQPVLTFHTTSQTIVGIVVGIFMGVLYIIVHEFLIRKYCQCSYLCCCCFSKRIKKKTKEDKRIKKTELQGYDDTGRENLLLLY